MNNKKKKTLGEYCRIKVDTEYVFLFLLDSKTKYTSQTSTINYILYKTHKFTIIDSNIEIIIAVIQYKMQVPFLGCGQLIHLSIRCDNNARIR